MDEDNVSTGRECIFPPCPDCKRGFLLPFSRAEDVFEKWKCSECGFTVEKREDGRR